jgi:TolB-like protein
MDQTASGTVLRFAGFALDGARGCLRGPDGAEVPLAPKPFDLLLTLARNSGRTLSKDALLDAVWPGVHVTEDSLFQAVREARRAIGDEAGHVLRSMPRRGYLLDAPVSSDAETDAATLAAPAEAPAPPADRPSVVVLPFQNIGGGPEQDYLADGIAEELTAALSRFRSLFVIARNSAAAFKGPSVDVREVGRALGVRYVVEGSLRQAGGRLRIAAQLVEAPTQAQLWSDRFEGAAEDLFALQDRMTAAIAPVLEPATVQAEIARASRKPTADLTAYDLYLRALPKYYTRGSAEMAEAAELLEAALRQDPQFHLARALLAHITWQLALFGRDPDIEGARERALDLARQVLAEDTRDPAIVAYCAYVLFRAGEADQPAASLLHWARTANPNCYEAWTYSAWHAIHACEPERALAHLAAAERLDPAPANGATTIAARCAANLLAGRFAQAVEAGRSAVAYSPRMPHAHIFYTASLGQLGDIAAARQAAEALLRVQPGYTLRLAAATRALRDEVMFVRLIEGLRRAGIPE